MKLVVDANILISALIKDGHTRKLLLLGLHDYFVPEFILEEAKSHLKELSEKTQHPEETIWETLKELFEKAEIEILNNETFENRLKEAENITPDPKDLHYIALALKLNCPIWSNDKKLKEQNKVRIITTAELSRNPTF